MDTTLAAHSPAELLFQADERLKEAARLIRSHQILAAAALLHRAGDLLGEAVSR